MKKEKPPQRMWVEIDHRQQQAGGRDHQPQQVGGTDHPRITTDIQSIAITIIATRMTMTMTIENITEGHRGGAVEGNHRLNTSIEAALWIRVIIEELRPVIIITKAQTQREKAKARA
jgi:hypothetical protein